MTSEQDEPQLCSCTMHYITSDFSHKDWIEEMEAKGYPVTRIE